MVLALVAGACGGDDDDQTASGDDTTTTTIADGDGGGEAPASTAGFDGTTIDVGALFPLSGPLQSVGEPARDGFRAYFEALNADGGVAGEYPVELLIADSQYDPPSAVEQYNRMRDDVVMIGAVLGTPIINALLEQVGRDDLTVVPLSFDSAWVHEPNLAPIGTPLQTRAALAIDWAWNAQDKEGSTVCSFYQEDPFGEASHAGVEIAAEELGFEIAEAVTYRRGDSEFSSQVSALESAGCEVIFLGAVQNVPGPALGLAAERGYEAMWLGQTGAWTESLADSAAAQYLQDNFYYLQEGPEWGDTSSPGMAEFIEAWDEHIGGAPDYVALLGWTAAQAAHQVLEEAVANGDLSRQGMLDALYSVEEVTFNGLAGDYQYGAPEDRQPPEVVSIFSVAPDAPGGIAIEEQDYTSDITDAVRF